MVKAQRDLSFLFCLIYFSLLLTPAFAASPTLGTVSPASGSTAPDTAKTFTCKYSDLDGWANLKDAYLLISTASTILANAAYLYYDQNANLLYLRNDTNTTWLGGYAPGSANTIENSFVVINCSLTSFTGSTSILTMNWNISFKQAFSGKAYNTYLYAKDDTGGTVGWTKRGAYTVNSLPQLGTITPSSGTGVIEAPQTFTTTYSDADGWQNIQMVYFLVSISYTSQTNTLFAYYDQNTNLLYLRNDAGTAWLGGFAPGSSNIIENSYAKLNCASTNINGSGALLTVNWAVVIKAPLTGTKNTYLYVKDDLNSYANWAKKGTWIIPNQAPVNGTVTPDSGMVTTEQGVNFTASYSDPDTWLNIQYVYFLVNTSTAGNNCLYAYYNQNTHKLYLRNDANSAWLGGYAPGSSYVIENSYVKLNCAATTVSGSASILTINWQVIFKPAFTGNKNLYLYVKDDANAYQNWTQKGSVSIRAESDTIAPFGTIKINNDALYSGSTAVTLNLSATDADSGMGQGAQMQFSNDNLTWSAPEAYAITKIWDLAPGDGQRTVYVKFKDVAGNWSEAYADTIILDTVAPKITSVTPDNNSKSYEQDPVLISTVVDDNGISPLEYQFSIDGVIKQAWSVQASYNWVPQEIETGEHILKIEVRDASGTDAHNIGVYALKKPIAPPG